MQRNRPLGRTGLTVTRLGLGLAALGRPGYITLGRSTDLPADRSAAVMEARTHAVLDAAYAAGIRVFDAARSYGRAEAFLSSWLDARAMAPGDVVVTSKWGYAYTADWRIDAERHEVKEHSAARLGQQWALSHKLLWTHLDVYQVHSATLDSGAVTDEAVLDGLAQLKAEHGVKVGLSLTGPRQADTLDRAMDVERDGQPLFDTVQATWNPLEPSVGSALRAAHEAGLGVIAKETLANGRLTARGLDGLSERAKGVLTAAATARGVAPSVWAIAASLAQPWADVVLSGAATVPQLHSNVAALEVEWTAQDNDALAEMSEEPDAYWGYRKTLPWQ